MKNEKGYGILSLLIVLGALGFVVYFYMKTSLRSKAPATQGKVLSPDAIAKEMTSKLQSDLDAAAKRQECEAINEGTPGKCTIPSSAPVPAPTSSP